MYLGTKNEPVAILQKLLMFDREYNATESTKLRRSAEAE